MNRREALIAVLAMPAATSSQVVKEMQTTTGKISVLSTQTQLHLPLADVTTDKAGITALNVTFEGKEINFTAQEIWDALSKPEGASLTLGEKESIKS